MKKTLTKFTLGDMAITGALCATQLAFVQVAGGSTTLVISVVESTQIAAGWGAKKR